MGRKGHKFSHHAFLTLDINDRLAIALDQIPRRKRTETLLRWARKGLAQEVLSGPDGAADAVTAEPLRTIATKVNHILEILQSGNGVGSLASANVATGEPTLDPATLEAESAALRANLLAAYDIEPLAQDNIADAKGAPE